MLSIKIEKEVKHENKIAFNLTARQLGCVLVGLAACILLYVVTKMPINILIFPMVAIAVVCGAFGWVKKDGLTLPGLIMRYAKRIVYQNQRLRYRTSNAYVRMYNKEYARLRASMPKKKKKIAKSKMKAVF